MGGVAGLSKVQNESEADLARRKLLDEEEGVEEEDEQGEEEVEGGDEEEEEEEEEEPVKPKVRGRVAILFALSVLATAENLALFMPAPFYPIEALKRNVNLFQV